MNLSLLVAVAELDQAATANDSFAQQAQSMGLLNTADMLRANFDTSAVIARLSARRFGVVALFANRGAAEVMSEHLTASIDGQNRNPRRQSNSSIRLGLRIFDAECHPADEPDIAPMLAMVVESMSAGEQSSLATA